MLLCGGTTVGKIRKIVTLLTMTEVAAAICIEGTKVLLTKRNARGKLPGYWEFPGGKREKGETLFECLEREIMEELNVKCKAVKIFAESVYEYEFGKIKLTAIITELLETKIFLAVHDEYKWAEIRSLCAYKLAPADRSVAELLVKKYAGEDCQ